MISRHRRHFIHRHRAKNELPYGVRVLAWSRAIRWIGWGFGEALIPVFIIVFSKTFAEAGLFSSSVDIASLVSLPIIGAWADKMPARTMVLLSLLLYPIVGASYFLAGAVGLAIYIVIARVANGFTWELENIGIETYYRRMVNYAKIGSSFGFIETWSHVAWISASLAGMVLVLFMPVHYLLFLIAPFSLIAYFVARKAPADEIKTEADIANAKPSFMKSYGKTLVEWKTWNSRLWLLGALVFFSSIVSALMYFFIPIDAYLTGANLPMVILITVFAALPALFSYKLGQIVDVRNKYVLIVFGLAGVAVVSIGLVLFPQYWFKLLAMFLMGIILELFYVAQSSLVTTLGPAETYGERGSAFESISVLCDLTAPLLIGVGLDLFGFSGVNSAVAAGALILCIVYRFLTK